MTRRREFDAMTRELLSAEVDRRTLLKRAALLGLATPLMANLLAACADDEGDEEDVAAVEEDDQDPGADVAAEEDEEDEEDDPEDTDDEEAVPEDADLDLDEVEDIPRERTLFLRYGGQEGRFIEHDLWNGYAIGASHQLGLGIIYEPLAFYSAFADEMIPWLAEDWAYNDELTELTINLRSGIEWSDGEPFSSADVEYTLNHLVELGAEIRWGNEVQSFVDHAEAVDDTTVVVQFIDPAPKFMYFMTYKFDIGLYIVPKHIYEGEDWTTFTAYNLEEGLPVTTGPWRVAFASPEQKLLDRRDSWWAVDQGLVDELPRVERVVYLPFADESSIAQQMITDQLDVSQQLSPMTVQRIMQDNPNVITHTYDQPPYGYVDWWPVALYVNHERPPFDEVDVRWALSYFIDREQVIEVAYDGAGSSNYLPMPTYPGLEPFVESVADLLEEYNTLEYNPERGRELMEQAGFEMNGDGWWERDGEIFELVVNGFAPFSDIGPIVAEQLRQNGIRSEYAQPPDWWNNFPAGEYDAGLSGHGGSVNNDPYDTLRLFQSTSVTDRGESTRNLTRWKNDEYDRIVDELAMTPSEDQERLLELFREAMEIWLPELPNIQIEEFYHRIPMNTTYWDGWPTESNPYVNAASYHLTFQLVLNELEPTQ